MFKKVICWLSLVLLSLWGYLTSWGLFCYFEDYGFPIFFWIGMFVNQLWNEYIVGR